MRGGRPRIGVGYSVPPEQVAQLIDAIYASFGSGLMIADSQENVPQDAAIEMLDMEVNRAGRMVRAPGLSLIEDANPRLLRYTFEQASLDFATELVTIDAPWFGYKGSTVYTWVNAGLSGPGPSGWGAANIAGVLLFSNGVDKSYSRLPSAAAVVDQSAQVIARTFGVAFGRTFAGYYVVGGVPQSLGFKWNAANGLYNDWTGIGSGAELMLADVGESDKIVVFLPVGLDALAMLMRKSLWVGYPTQDYLRPADPRLRVASLGCVAMDTAKATPGGVTFLSDDGVGIFSLTDASIISDAVNSELLPLDYSRLKEYTAAYSPVLGRYILCTPYNTWIYEFPHVGGTPVAPGTGRKGRWFRRSLVANNVLSWSQQSGGLYWDQTPGTWDQQIGTWDGAALQASDAPPEVHFIKGTKLARQYRQAFNNLDQALTPYWKTPQNDKVKVTDQYTTLGFEVEYSSYIDTQLRLSGSDYQNEDGLTVMKSLPITAGKLKKWMIWGQGTGQVFGTGMGARAKIEIISGDAEISRIRQIIIPSGPVIGSL